MIYSETIYSELRGLTARSFLRHASLHLVEDVSIQGLVLRLRSESRLVWCDVLWILHAVASTSDDLRELSVPCPLTSSEAGLLVGVTVGGVVRIGDHVCVVGWRLTHVIDYAVFLGQLAADGFDRVNVSDFCHLCSAMACSTSSWVGFLPRWRVTRLRRVYRRFTAVLPPSPTQSVLYLAHRRHYCCFAAISSLPGRG